MNILDSTPIEKYQVDGFPIFVKREDLCVPPPGPPFSKMRGMWPHLESLYRQGVRKVVYAESNISMAGWGIAYCGKKIGLEVVIFDPILYRRKPNWKEEPPHRRLLNYHREKWKENGAKIVPTYARTLVSVNYYRARNWISGNCPDAVLLPLGMSIEETVEATAKEASFLRGKGFHSLVVNVGSGTICSGILRALEGEEITIWAIAVDRNSCKNRHHFIYQKSKVLNGGLLGTYRTQLKVINPGYAYQDKVNGVEAPFPCHPFYDLKAWKWLTDNLDLLKPPVLFWNIGNCPFDLG